VANPEVGAGDGRGRVRRRLKVPRDPLFGHAAWDQSHGRGILAAMEVAPQGKIGGTGKGKIFGRAAAAARRTTAGRARQQNGCAAQAWSPLVFD
jgi:hypothetical protein